MSTLRLAEPAAMAVEIRVRGRVQGVGFRPTVWRLARELGLSGEVLNDGDGVLIRAAGERQAIDALVARLGDEPPPLARIARIETQAAAFAAAPGFRIVESRRGAGDTEIAPDAAICPACAAEIVDPYERRFRYPFATCTALASRARRLLRW